MVSESISKAGLVIFYWGFGAVSHGWDLPIHIATTSRGGTSSSGIIVQVAVYPYPGDPAPHGICFACFGNVFDSPILRWRLLMSDSPIRANIDTIQGLFTFSGKIRAVVALGFLHREYWGNPG